MRASLRRLSLRFAEPLETSYGRLRSRELIVLEVAGRDGVAGRGEAAPLEAYDGVALELVAEALDAHAAVLSEAADDDPGGELLERCRQAADLPQALAAVDMALWDRAGRRRGLPVSRLLASKPAASVPVNAAIAIEDPVLAADAAARAVRDGYRAVKLKVGLGRDGERVAAVRAALGPGPLLRLDANGAWNGAEASRMVDELAPAGIELVEEPVHGIEQQRALRGRVGARIAMDETVALAGALASGAADAVCLKISACGGISGLLAAASLVRATGSEPYVASTYDGPLGIAAALHCAAALAPLPHCGLATLAAFEGGLDALLPVREGAIEVPTGPGLGLDWP